MIFSSVATAVILAVGCQALVTPRAKHLADFRLYSGLHCNNNFKNLGIWTLVEGDFKEGGCQSLRDDTVESIRLEDIRHKCELSFFTDDKCLEKSRHVVKERRQCGNAPIGTKFKSFTYNCDPLPTPI
ncbi:hypothetical protein CP533_0986 [Ophiocordyceps camponoti-saundersi (nom. inval.)]|nr:hypothetical protein CP533_0986 [Ophiocordyceps camponoti-saundersi (nom. inval.)]